MTQITELIRQVHSGDPAARDALFSAAYSELKTLAHARLRDGGRNTVLDTTALVHESYLKYLSAGRLRAEDRRAFFAFASTVMRSVIVDAARQRQSERHGGRAEQVTLVTHIVGGGSADPDVLGVHEALEVLAQAEPRLAQVVEMRYFGGYSENEIAETLQLTERTVRRDRDTARLLLSEMLKD